MSLIKKDESFMKTNLKKQSYCGLKMNNTATNKLTHCFMRKNINDAIFFSKKIFKFCIHFEPQFFQNFVTRFFFLIRWHFVEQNFSSFFQKGLCPSQNIVDIRSRTRCDNIKVSSKIRIFGEYLCSLLYSRNILKAKIFNEKIHCTNLFSNTIK